MPVPAVDLPFDGRVSPDEPAARERNLRWVQRQGLISGPADESRYQAWDIAGLMARWLPLAQGPGLDLGIDAVGVGALMDDQFDGPLSERPAAVGDACGRMIAVLDPGSGPPPGNLGTAFADVWKRMCDGASPQWRSRAARHWRWFFEAFPEEARFRTRRTPPNRAQFMALRRKSGLVYTMLDLVEAAYGFETSSRARLVPVAQRLLELTADVVDTVNDLYSLEKEESRGDVHNLVLVIQHERQCPRSEAIAEAEACVYAWCDEFTTLESQLADACAQHQLPVQESVALGRLTAGMRDAMAAFPGWSQRSGRYSQLVPPGQAAYSELLSRPAQRNGKGG